MEKNTIYAGNNGSYLINEKDLNSISGIESLTYSECLILKEKLLNSELINFKDHELFLLNLGGYFGYSCLVFLNKKHLYYADDFQLHHKIYDYENNILHTEKTLKDYYLNSMNSKLFTINELMGPCKDYNNYKQMDYYVRNYWIQQFEYLSAFQIITTKDQEKQFDKKRKAFPLYNTVSFCYVKEEKALENITIVEHLKNEYTLLFNDNEKFRNMIRYELFNHEAGITMDYHETLCGLGIKYNSLTEDQKRILNQELNYVIDHTNC